MEPSCALFISCKKYILSEILVINKIVLYLQLFEILIHVEFTRISIISILAVTETGQIAQRKIIFRTFDIEEIKDQIKVKLSWGKNEMNINGNQNLFYKELKQSWQEKNNQITVIKATEDEILTWQQEMRRAKKIC